MTDRRTNLVAALKEATDKLDSLVAMAVSQGQPTTHPENPMLLMMFLGAAMELGQKYNVQITDLASAEEEFSGDAEVKQLADDVKAQLKAMGLPTEVPKPKQS
ncbi:hypothetical protein DIPPA_04691 [Diplonema papillatum]|nr:hypothetical protein DIPPA_04691 [Diplonema papillatum]